MSVMSPHSVVVGGGCGGMSMALLLAEAGHRVTLLEATRHIGGCMQRFTRQGIPFDTGFHFTGGFEDILSQMLCVLKMDDLVLPSPFRTRHFFPQTGESLACPNDGIDSLCAFLCNRFPNDATAIQDYYRIEKDVIRHTPMFDLLDTTPLSFASFCESDTLSLADFMQKHQLSEECAAVLCGYAMCHGNPPHLTSMTYHCRVSYGLDNHIRRVKHGGQAFIDAFVRQADKLDVAIRPDSAIASCGELDASQQCHHLTLTTGEELTADNVFFAIHPSSVLALLPEQARPPALMRRARHMSDTCSFFSIYASIDSTVKDFTPEMVSYLATTNLEKILAGQENEYGIGLAFGNETSTEGNPCHTLTAFRPMSESLTASWQNVQDYHHAPDYLAFKERHTAQIIAAVERACPNLRGHLKVLATASPLTFADWRPPNGSGYGIVKRLSPIGFFGQLPVRNFYALGQNALAPGVLGTLMTSFLTARMVLGDDAYFSLVHSCLK